VFECVRICACVRVCLFMPVVYVPVWSCTIVCVRVRQCMFVNVRVRVCTVHVCLFVYFRVVENVGVCSRV